jgi:hypothetical protein
MCHPLHCRDARAANVARSVSASLDRFRRRSIVE